jgi:uncharacterized protein (DUF58 family)
VARRRLPPTREGWWFIGTTLIVGAIAVDAGLNLLFLMFATMACLLAASAALSRLALFGLRVRRVLPPVIHAGTPYLMGISLENRKRWFPSFSIEVEDVVDRHPIDKRCYFLKLPAGRTQETSYRHTLPRRGPHRLSGFRLATKFPFGLMQRAKDITDAEEIVVYPALAPLPPDLLRGLPAVRAPGRDRAPGREGEFAGLRPFRPGDDPRDIHWRSTARRGMAVAIEHEDDRAREVTLVLDNAGVAVDDSVVATSDAAFETAVSQAASLCVELGRRGFAVGLAWRGGELPPASGKPGLARAMRALALVGRERAPLPRPRGGLVIAVRPAEPPKIVGVGFGGARRLG